MSKNGAQVWVLQQVPEQDYTPQRVLKRALDNESLSSLEAMSLSEHQKLQSRVLSIFETLDQKNVQLIDPSQYLCNKKECPFMHNDEFLYRDDDHLSPYGAYHIEPVLEPLLEQIRNYR